MVLPQPITGAEEYLKAVHERLGETNELLRTLLDRTPAPAAQPEGSGAVELREPAKAADEPGALDGRPASLREPAPQKKPARRQGQRARTTDTTKGA
ncbi:hypothetical protein [Microbispora rosea]|uniref:hypothetical protein n=1 Tax=Microbispora rosea TaxID=58117 RepID=UPI0037B9489B